MTVAPYGRHCLAARGGNVQCEEHTQGCKANAIWRVQAEMNETQYNTCTGHLTAAIHWAYEHATIKGPIVLVERLAS